MKTFNIYIIALLLSCSAFAQQFTVASKVSGIQATGLHTLALSPEFRSHADGNLYGMRIINSKGKEVPYIMMSAEKGRIQSAFQKYPMLLKRVLADSVSLVTVENINSEKWHEITLSIANTDAVKTYSISGSNDNSQWFGLVNNQTLGDLSSRTDMEVYKTLPMPVNTYKYFKIEFNDKTSLPLNVLAAGKITGTQITAPLQEVFNPYVNITQLRIEKKTRIAISFNEPVTVNQIKFAITAPAFYNRNATLLLWKTRKRRKKTENYLEEVSRFTLSSSGKNVLENIDLTETNFVVEIDNKDNEPLDISDVKLLQTPVSLVAYLKAGEHYTVKAGDPQLAAADYDLQDFKDDMPAVLPQAVLQKPVVLKAKPGGINANKSPWIMWACISIGALILLYFCYSLIKDMKKTDNTSV